jgi:hypothetical protein
MNYAVCKKISAKAISIGGAQSCTQRRLTERQNDSNNWEGTKTESAMIADVDYNLISEHRNRSRDGRTKQCNENSVSKSKLGSGDVQRVK